MMTRQCYSCSRSMLYEPALKASQGLLCFVCKFKCDEAGGEQFLEDTKIYSAWEKRYGAIWKQRQKNIKSYCLSFVCSFALWIISICCLQFPLVIPVSIALIATCLSFLAWKSKRKERTLECPMPPAHPVRDRTLLQQNPEVVFTSMPKPSADWSNEHDSFPGYPPDWEIRKRCVLARDGFRCRLCDGEQNLHVHHVWPVSYSANHTMQNMITLCKWCHYKQEYWNHKQLLRENIKAQRKYFVPSYTRKDGIVVKAHKKKVGRRGKFWKSVRENRQRYKP